MSAAILQIFTELTDHRLIVTGKRICFSQIKSSRPASLLILHLLAVWFQLRAGCILSRFSDFRPKYRDHGASCFLTMFSFSTWRYEMVSGPAKYWPGWLILACSRRPLPRLTFSVLVQQTMLCRPRVEKYNIYRYYSSPLSIFLSIITH